MTTEGKGHNWKARQKIADVKIIDEAREKVVANPTGHERFDDSNPFILPSKKRKTIVKKQHASTVKLLSKKQRKFYEKVLEKKKKKEGRAALMQQLHLVQGPANVLEKLTSITEVQTRGRKRMHQADLDHTENLVNDVSSSSGCGFVKVRRKLRQNNVCRMPVGDSNVIGFEQSDTESDSQSDENPKVDNAEMTSVSTEKVHDNETTDSLCCEDEDKKLSVDTTNNVLNQSEGICEAKTCGSLEQSVIQDESETELQKSTCTLVKTSKFFITVDRDPLIQRARLKLPIIGEEQVIMEAIEENDVVIIAGETGSGKTTQLPQFLYEAGYTSNDRMIGITEPRRVAAVSMSRRVAQELNLTSKEVSYLIRFDGNTTPETQIKFMTDGVLIKELQKDFLLSKYSAIILDEAHERSVFTDVLIGLLSRITTLRRKRNNPLKLIIMSATLRLSDFTENKKLFKTVPPVIKVDGRQFPVTIHFNKETKEDYLSEAYKKACKIHTQLPEGGILIFLTGQQEVNTLVRKLRKTFPVQKKCARTERKGRHERSKRDEIVSDDEDENQNSERPAPVGKETIPVVSVEDYAIRPTDEELELSESEDDVEDVDIQYQRQAHSPMWVLPLYSLLSSAKQARIFETPPSGCRFCVVATNVAETSLTIPNVKYVIDCGRIKMRAYDKLTGVSTFTVPWTSKASADQRAGRAGRTSAGHCYRLYSSAMYNHEFEDWSVPEIMRKPADDLLLMMKALRIDRVINFPFPSTPDLVQLQSAERRLTLLGALKPNKDVKDEWASTLTPLGKSMAVYPVAPRFAKMLCVNRQHDLLSYTIAIVAALSVQEILLVANDNYHKIWRSWAGSGNSLLLGDVMVLLRALGAAEYTNSTKGEIDKFCEIYGLRYKAIVEARKLRVQLTNQVNIQVPNLNLTIDPKMLPPTDDQARKLRQIILTGMVDHVARKLSNEELKQAGLSLNKAAYRTADMEDLIFLHSSSVLRKLKPEWIVFQEVFESKNDRLYARGICAIEPEWLPEYAAPLCNISDPLKDPAPYYDVSKGRVMCFVSSTFGRSGWPLPETQLEYPLCEDKFKFFAKFFLDGCITPKLEEYAQHLLSPSDLVFKSWAKFLTRRSNNLLRALMERKVDSRRTLKMQWLTDSKYLLESYLEWLPESAHEEVQNFWPPACC